MKSCQPNRASLRGFTLVEMMTVVVMVGILATLAVFGVRKYILSAKSGEAVSMMTSIKSAEEAFKDETFVYLDVSTDFSSSTNWYPTSAHPGMSKVAWGASAPTSDKWKTLGVQPDGPVQFVYAVVAAAPGATIPAVPTGKSNAAFGFSGSASQWMYVACAKADLNGDGAKYTYVLSHSLSNEVYVENEGE